MSYEKNANLFLPTYLSLRLCPEGGDEKGEEFYTGEY